VREGRDAVTDASSEGDGESEIEMESVDDDDVLGELDTVGVIVRV
jgi:hypothetical protein